jgi:hypothetical protein
MFNIKMEKVIHIFLLFRKKYLRILYDAKSKK